MEELLRIRGARVHNLKNIGLDLPHNRLTVVTGVSGSGKSSLVFDTIYAEGQRRYVESLSAYARQFLDRMEKPDVDEIDGLAPPVAIRQRNTTRNPRSTVATATEIHDYLRLLFARAGETWCPNCGVLVERDTVDPVARQMLAQPEGSRWYALFPINTAPSKAVPLPHGRGGQEAAVPLPHGRGLQETAVPLPHARGLQGAAIPLPHGRGLQESASPDRQGGGSSAGSPHPGGAAALRDHLFDLRKRGFTRLYQDGRVFEFSTPESLLELDFARTVYVLADRLVMRPGETQRVVDTVELCYRESGEVIFEQAGEAEPLRLRFSERFACRQCGMEFPVPEPSLFSFNTPRGACPACQGFGNSVDYDLGLIIPDPSRSINDGAVDPWTKPNYDWGFDLLEKVRLDVPYEDLEKDEQTRVVKAVHKFFAQVEKKKYKVHVRVFLSRYRGYTDCRACQGSRLRPEALNPRIAGRTIAEVARMNIGEAREFFAGLALAPEAAAIAGKVLVEVQQRLAFLNNVGLEYLTLDRLSSTLSGGEAQRIQLATCLGSRLVGACYVLDEPSIGLHSRDTARLIRILEDLRDLGNTVLVVEHDAEVIRAADHIIDLGPGAGELGGEVTFSGTLKQLAGNGARRNGSLTGRYLNGELRTSLKTARRPVDPKRVLKFVNCRANNLRGIGVELPLDMMTVVTGVSGSGKSTLVHEVIHKSMEARVLRQGGGEAREMEAEKAVCARVERAELVREVVLVDQSPIGRTPRSNPVTYSKAFDLIRVIFANTPEATKRGYTPGHFSFNIAGGRCETCQGDGTVTVEMQFLADVELLCEDCRGTRYKPAILDVRHKGLNIHEVLRLTISEALGFFAGHARLLARLQPMADVGLGYLRLGQSATTLSGGEAQRVKLAAHLTQASSKGVLYLFDEPTTGLHFHDIARLLDAFERLIRKGASLLIIEHNLEVIRHADWIIDLGPEGGAAGGRVVAAGTPETVAAATDSHTARYLRPLVVPAG